jgi:ABC-type branched-subunit amino acid transport system substrate-binding protein
VTLDGPQFYNPALTDLATPIKALLRPGPNGDPGFDALLLPDDASRIKTVAQALPANGVQMGRVRLLGTLLWATMPQDAQAAVTGGWYAAPPQASHDDFVRRVQAAFGARPPAIASLAYDATALAAVLAKRGSGFTPQSLTDPSGFAGIDGLFRLRPDGTAERGYAIMEIQPGGNSRPVDQAPTSFATLPSN